MTKHSKITAIDKPVIAYFDLGDLYLSDLNPRQEVADEDIVNGGIKTGHSAAQKQATWRRVVLRIETLATFSGGPVRRAGLPACRAGSPEKAYIYLRDGLRPA